jgi:hypothetical protein
VSTSSLPGGIAVVPSGATTRGAAEHVGRLLDGLPVEVRSVLYARDVHIIVFDPSTEAGVAYIDHGGRAIVVLTHTAPDSAILHEAAHVFRGHKSTDPAEYARCQAEADALAAEWAAFEPRAEPADDAG